MQTNNILKIVGVVSVALIALSVGYHFLVSVPSQNKLAEEKYSKAQVEECLEKADAQWEPAVSKLVNGASEIPLEDFESALNYALGSWNTAKARCNTAE